MEHGHRLEHFLEYVSLMEFDDGVWIGLSFYGDLTTTRISSFLVIAQIASYKCFSNKD